MAVAEASAGVLLTEQAVEEAAQGAQATQALVEQVGVGATRPYRVLHKDITLVAAVAMAEIQQARR